jgi:Ca2+-binding EF-hand superfamily protein
MCYHAVRCNTTRTGSYDYSKPFKLFDESGDGIIPIDELRKMLYKLNIDSLLRENQVVELMNRFDTDRTGMCLCMRIHLHYYMILLLTCM